jgi:hypothetical protein
MNNFTPFPLAEDALRELDDFLPLVWEAMDAAITGAASFFTEGIAVDACLFPNLVRYHAKTFFSNRHVSASDEEVVPQFDSIGLANNGLCVVHGRYALRIRKSDDGLVPVPGNSLTLQQFYRQQPLPFNLSDRPAQIVDTSLLVLWGVDSDYHLDGLQLTCPRAGARTRSSVETHWSIQLPNPINRATVAATNQVDELEGIEALEQPDSTRKSG